MKNISFILPLIGMLVFNSSYASLVDGLVTYYSFDGNANDGSGNSNNGVVNGATLTSDRFGNANSAYNFDGINDFISASADILPTAERTTALWFKADTVSSYPVLLSYGGGYCGSSWFMGLNPANTSSYYLTSHCEVNNLISPYSQDPINAWFHFAISTDTNGSRMYVNGVEVASNSNYITNTNVVGTDLSIGVATSPSGFAPYTDANVGYFDGSIDDVRIYNRALSQSEISQLVAVPIPAAIWLLCSGLLSLIGIREFLK